MENIKVIKRYLWLKRNIKGLMIFTLILMIISLFMGSSLCFLVMCLLGFITYVLKVQVVDKVELIREFARDQRRLVNASMKLLALFVNPEEIEDED